MSKEMWIDAHNEAVDEAMQEFGWSWEEAYNSDYTAKRADDILRDRIAGMIDHARERAKYE